MARRVDGPEITGQVFHKQTGQAYGPVTVTASPKVYTDPEMSVSVTSLTTDGTGVFSCYAPPGQYTFTTTAVDAATIEPVEVLGHEGGTGTPQSAAYSAAELPLKQAASVDISAFGATNAPAFNTTIVTYVGLTNSLVEPSVYFNPLGFGADSNGKAWRYWMVAGPYEASNSANENPSLWVSDDGDTWQVPPGVTNPLVPAPAGGNNCDPQLFEIGGTLYLTWTLQNAASPLGDNTYMISSTNGVTWSSSTLIIPPSSTTGHVALSNRFAWDGTKWHSWALDLTGGVPYVIQHRTATQLTGPWSAPTGCTITVPTGKSLWEFEVKRVFDQFVMLVNVTNSGANTAGGQLYFATSSDGLTWTMAQSPLLSGTSGWDTSIYKAGFVPTVFGTSLGFTVWYSAYTGTEWHVAKVQARPRGQFVRTKTGKALYFTPPLGVSTAALGNNSLRCAPIVFDRAVTLDRIGVEVTAIGDVTGPVIRLGVYADDGDGHPGKLLLDAGTVSGIATGWQEAVISLALPAGMYWLASVTQGVVTTAPTVRTHAGSTIGAIQSVGSTVPLTLSGNAGIGYQVAGVSGALPNPFAAPPAGLSASSHRAAVRVS